MNEAVNPATRISRAPGIIAEVLDGDLVMLDPERDSYLRLNRAGKLLWDALEAPQTVASLAELLARDTGIEPERAAADALAFARALVASGAAVAASDSA